MHHQEPVARRNAEDWDFLEGEHAYIQWMFPLEVKSGMVARAPIVTPQDMVTFADDEDLQNTVLEMLDIMLHFYGMRRTRSGRQAVCLSPTA